MNGPGYALRSLLWWSISVPIGYKDNHVTWQISLELLSDVQNQCEKQGVVLVKQSTVRIPRIMTTCEFAIRINITPDD